MHLRAKKIATPAICIIVLLVGVTLIYTQLNTPKASPKAEQKLSIKLDGAIDTSQQRTWLKTTYTSIDEMSRIVKAKDSKSTKQKTVPSRATSPSNKVTAHQDPTKLDVVVNKKHPLVPKSYTPRVTSVSCAGYGSATFSTNAASAFKSLCSAAKNGGLKLSTSSSYRSYSTQVSTYNYWVSVNGKVGADKVSARPGYSEHQTGLAADFSTVDGATLDAFCGSKEQQWMAENAYKYGWIQRYTASNSAVTGYDPECWHYRYIGETVAKNYVNSNAGSLEKFWGVSGGGY